MLATEIIRKLKIKIRILWSVIVILSVLLYVTNYNYRSSPIMPTKNGQITISEQKKEHFVVPKKR